MGPAGERAGPMRWAPGRSVLPLPAAFERLSEEVIPLCADMIYEAF